MVEASQFFDSRTVSSNQGSEQESINVSSEDTITIQLVGDSNSTDLDVKALSSVGNTAGVLGEYAKALTGQDLTSKENNSKIYTYEVSDVGEFVPKVINNSASDTVLDAYYIIE